jgi:hypothetical protein
VFRSTWGDRAGPPAAKEYWAEVISTIKNSCSDFLFIAEAYWDLEWELQQLGFDFCYDKVLYDRLEHGTAESIQLHLCADLPYQSKLCRFIENHDELRAAATFPAAKQRAAAVTMSTLPGARLLHEGQLEGRSSRVPVFLGRRPDEPPDPEMQEFYHTLLEAVSRPVFRQGQWRLCDRRGWSDNTSFHNLIAWTWVYDERYIIVVNFSDSPAQGHVPVQWADVAGNNWRLIDLPSGLVYERSGDEMLSPGLYVALAPWSYHFFQCERIASA